MEDFEPEFLHEASTEQLLKEALRRTTFKIENVINAIGGRAELLKSFPIETLLSEAFDRRGFKFDDMVYQLNRKENLSFIISLKKDNRVPETWVRGFRAEALRMLKEITEEIYHEYRKDT